MGKWVYLIVIVVVGGFLAYYMFFTEKSLPGTPMATAEEFMKAVLKNDIERAKSLCIPDALSNVDSIIDRIRSVNPDKLGIKYSNMNSRPPKRGVLVSFTGNMIPMEMLKEGETWKIANISIN